MSSDADTPRRIVGIGGSKGALDAFKPFLAGLAPDTGMAFVFVLHLYPQHRGVIETLQALTVLPVKSAADGVRPRADAVYVIQPNCDLFLSRGRFRNSTPRTFSERHHQVDLFLKSLAVDAGPNAISVILSGGDGDGAEGSAAIKAHGGLTFAQDGSARVSSMPRHAAATGCLDLVLSPAQIAAEISALAHGPGGRSVES